MPSLEHRLLAFLRLWPAAEAIDDLPIPSTGPKRADFLLAGRAVVVEVKSLSADPSHKVESTLEPHRDRPQFPLFYGEVAVAKVVAHLPDGDQIMKQLAQRLTRSVERAFRDADKQIASTKAIFGIPEADGVLLLVNEGVEVLSPEVIAWQLTQMLQKRGSDSQVRYPNVSLIWVLSEAHRLDHPAGIGVQLLPALLMASEDRPPTACTEALVDALQPAWAAFNKLPLVHLGNGEADAFIWRNASDELNQSPHRDTNGGGGHIARTRISETIHSGSFSPTERRL